jgi:hypothetical protein
MSSSFPSLRLWDHPVFRHPDWMPFTKEVLRHKATAEDPLNVQIQKALPLVSERMTAMQNSMVNTVREESSSVRLNGLESKLDGFQSDIHSNLEVNEHHESHLRKQGQPLSNFMLVPANPTKSKTPAAAQPPLNHTSMVRWLESSY